MKRAIVVEIVLLMAVSSFFLLRGEDRHRFYLRFSQGDGEVVALEERAPMHVWRLAAGSPWGMVAFAVLPWLRGGREKR